jgi:hypothetical protein
MGFFLYLVGLNKVIYLPASKSSTCSGITTVVDTVVPTLRRRTITIKFGG